jgi:short-subunit dehydrogenase
MTRTALVTGASAGIGKAFAEHLASDGFDLVLTARRQQRLEELAHALEHKHGVRAQVISADLADPAAPEQIAQALRARGLEIDVLINNAGFGIRTAFLDTSWTQHAQLIQVEVTAVAHLTHLCLPGMLERGYGRIVHVASLAGLLPGAPTSTLYAAAKSFLVKFSESLTAELKDTGVFVCAVCPGFTRRDGHAPDRLEIARGDVVERRASRARRHRCGHARRRRVRPRPAESCAGGDRTALAAPRGAWIDAQERWPLSRGR